MIKTGHGGRHTGRKKPEVLKVRYKGRSIADVLGMTVNEAVSFFEGHLKVQGIAYRKISEGVSCCGA